MITFEEFDAECKTRTGCTFTELGYAKEDMALFIRGEENVRDAISALISEDLLDDLTAPWGC